MHWSYFVWIPLMLAYNALACWLSVTYNHASFWKMWLYMYVVSFIPTWAITAYFSKNLIFDSFLYDSLLVVSSPIFFVWFGQAAKFSLINWIGVVVTLLGLLMVKWNQGVAH